MHLMLCVCCRYTDQQLDREFIEVLRETCFKLVERSEVREGSGGSSSSSTAGIRHAAACTMLQVCACYALSHMVGLWYSIGNIILFEECWCSLSCAVSTWPCRFFSVAANLRVFC
jgi:hypothetical protein